MHWIDEVHLNHPFAGKRVLRDVLRQHGFSVSRKHVATLSARWASKHCIGPKTSRRHAAYPIYPHMLRNCVIERLDEVWAMDITSIPMSRGFAYLASVLDSPSWRVLALR